MRVSLTDSSVRTPAFLVDRKTVQDNCDRMRQKAERSGVVFRPHVKTHKTAEIARMQFGGERGAITVSTLAEAEFFASRGFDDITYAVPISPDKFQRAANLAAGIRRLNILIDSFTALKALEQFHVSRQFAFDTFLKVDCGYHRAGVDPEAADSVTLARAMSHSPALRFRGLLTHAGHSYHSKNSTEILAIARAETGALTAFRERLAADGTRGLVRSVGSTPTASLVEKFEDADEVRPGNYVFYDAFQAAIGACSLPQCAVSVMATVIGSYPQHGHLLIDAGALALSKDLGADHLDPGAGFGVVCDLELRLLPARLAGLSQEHGKIAAPADVIARYPLGSRLRIIPNHSCLTAALFDVYRVVEAGNIVDEWKPVRGW